MSLTFNEGTKSWLFNKTKIWADLTREMLKTGRPQANAHLILDDQARVRFWDTKTAAKDGDCLLLHVRLTSRKGFVMTYYSDLAKPGTEVWETVRAALVEADRE